MPRPVSPYVPTPDDEKAIRHAAAMLLGKTGIVRDDLPDIMQEMRIALFLRARKFRKGKKRAFAVLRTSILKSCSQNILRERNQPSARYKYNPAFSLDEMLIDNEEESASIGDYLTTEGVFADGTERDESDRWALEIDYRDKFNTLPKSDQRLFLAVMRSTAKDVAKKMDKPYTTIFEKFRAIILYLSNGIL